LEKKYVNILYWFLAIIGSILIYKGTNLMTLWGVVLLILAVRLVSYLEKKEGEK